MKTEAKAKILVVEDEGIVALDNIQMLTELGYDIVGHAATGEDAIKEAERTNPDLILMDINLGGKLDGIEAAERINAQRPTGVVFVTAHAEEDTLRRAKLVRPFGYIIKPFELDELRATVEIAIAQTGHEVDSGDREEIVFDSDVSSLTGVLAKLKLFQGFKTEDLEQLSQNASLKQFDAGAILQSPADDAPSAFLLQQGRLNVTQFTTNDKELTIELLLPGDIYGFIRALSPHSPVTTVRAVAPGAVWLFPASALKRLGEKNQVLWKSLAEELFHRLERTTALAVGLAHSRVEDRIISALLALSTRIGKTTTASEAVRLFLTRRELSELTGTTPETAIRITKALEREGFLDLTKPGVIKIPSIDKLEKRAAGNA